MSNISVIAEMPLLLLLLLVLPFSDRVSSEQSGVEENVEEEEKSEKLNDIDKKVDELMQRMERMDISWKLEKADLEKKLEVKNAEVENLQKRVKEGELQFESRAEELMLSTQRKNENQEIASLKKQVTDMESKVEEVASLKSEMRAEVKKEVDKGLRDLPFEMVCAYKHNWDKVGIMNYDRISMEFNNSDRPGGLFVQIYSHNIHTGGDGTMNIETGVFTTVTSGYYIVTYSAAVRVYAGDSTDMWLHHNGVQVEESFFATQMNFGTTNVHFILDQGSKTVVSIALLVFNC